MNLLNTIIPKSDQLNADDLISGPLTVKIRDIKGTSEPTQPVSIYYDGDNGKPYKPCKSMRRVLVAAWGADGAAFVGRSLTLFTDNEVVFGGIKVGGIRISHLSHIDRDLTMPLTVSKAQRRPYTVKRLEVAALPVLPVLDESHKHWAAICDGIKSGKTTVDALRLKYSISENTALSLSSLLVPNEGSNIGA